MSKHKPNLGVLRKIRGGRFADLQSFAECGLGNFRPIVLFGGEREIMVHGT